MTTSPTDQKIIDLSRKSGIQRACGTDPKNRQKDDYYSTDPAAVQTMMSVENFNGEIWEPCCGEGHISNALIRAGYNVMSTDLVDRGYGETGLDFLTMMSDRKMTNNIVTNPPYKHAEAFIRQAIKVSRKKTVMLLRLAFLEGQKRRDGLFKYHPPSRIWVCSKRVTTLRNGDEKERGGGGMVAMAWFVWDHDSDNEYPVIGWI